MAASDVGVHATATAWVGAQELDLDTCACAAAQGHHDVILRLRLAGCPWDASACTAAAAAGRLDTLKFLRSHDEALGGVPCPWDETTCAAAAASGRIDVIAWLRDGDDPCPWDARTMAAAAARGHYRMIYWLCGMRWGAARARTRVPCDGASWRARHRCPCEPTVFAAAAATGQIGIMSALYARGVPWDASACAAAAGNGHLGALVWLRARRPPCPWDERTTQGAASGGHQDCLAMALAGGCPVSVDHAKQTTTVYAADLLNSSAHTAGILLPAFDSDSVTVSSAKMTPIDAPLCTAPPAYLASVNVPEVDAYTRESPCTDQYAPRSPDAVAGTSPSVHCDWADQGEDVEGNVHDHKGTNCRSGGNLINHDRLQEEAQRAPRHRSGAKERAKRERRAQAAKVAAATATTATTTMTATVHPPATAPTIAMGVPVLGRKLWTAAVRPEFSFAAAAATAGTGSSKASCAQPELHTSVTTPEVPKSPLPFVGSPKARRRKRGGKGRR
ncbi:ankyrin repeat protein [Pandoravirus inopinatum]|uniref:Ankyrin repeat protein n=1 Tax=Pandoravirus inopinatum TaxID=1605721 RepID=A0A0B5JDG0_9VIRU|nr:ankyrin repeat protein [Pandoravirus inopinatum]AJF97722.1 ankyrin repeat protein [Pandoravirus inopinatum]